MAHPFASLLSPARVGQRILKNHMMSTCCLPHFLQGSENFPSESVITFVEGLAKSGSALVTIPDRFDNTRHLPMEDVKRGPCWDPTDPSVDNYLSAMVEAVHFQGSLITAQLSKFKSLPRDGDVYAHVGVIRPAMMLDLDDDGRNDPTACGNTPFAPHPLKELTREQMTAVVEEAVSRCRYYQSVGFDGICLHYAYSYNTIGRFLSPETNRRTDEYGGCVENRARFPLEIVDGIRAACGPRFLIELQISGDDMSEEDLVAFARLCQGRADLLQLRMHDMDHSHATAYNYDGVSLPPSLHYAKLIKESGVRIAVAPNGGFHNPVVNEQLLEQGAVDLIAMARPFICEPDYAEKLLEQRPEDIIPCLHCNKCHEHVHGSFISSCAVNPQIGIAHRKGQMYPDAPSTRRVAVIGGGPAGLRAALLCAEKGCSVHLFERKPVLGGQLTHADYPQFKWALRDYKNYLIAQVEKHPAITLHLNRAPQPEELEGAFDGVIAALGGSPAMPPIPGLDTASVWSPMGVYGHESELGQRVVMVGGSESAVETALYLAECGHEVTVLTRQAHLAENAWCVHAYALMRRRWLACPRFHSVVQAETVAVTSHSVTYRDGSGSHTIPCDSVVVSGGIHSHTAEALAFSKVSPRFFMIGDCVQPGNVRACNRMALAAASKL